MSTEKRITTLAIPGVKASSRANSHMARITLLTCSLNEVVPICSVKSQSGLDRRDLRVRANQ